MKHRLGRILLASTLALTVLAPTASIVSAATCYGSGCNGKSPQTTGCSADGQTAAWKYIKNSSGTNIGKVEHRWSDTCQASWSRVTSYIGATTIREEIYGAQGNNYVDTDYGATQGYSPMAVGLWGSEACGKLANNSNWYACARFDPD
jgi:hypothetical protein